MPNLEFLEAQADLLQSTYAGWEQRSIERIAKKVNRIGKMNLADVKSLNNMAMAKEEMDIIIKDLAATTGQSISEINDIYSQAIASQHRDNKYLYDYRHKDFIPFKDNRQLQAIVRAHSKNTASTMINITNTKALGFIGKDGKFVKMQDRIFDVFGKATMELSTGASDFTTAMRGIIEELGGSGITVHYGSGVNRRLDTVARQNLLWGAKQTSIEYNDMIGEELGCDGIEVDYHSNPRPSHRFMQGEMFSLNGKKTVNGVTYEDAKEALERLEDYGCLHYKTPVILGVSEPRYSKDQLNEMRQNDLKMHKVGDVKKTGYEWTQKMRQLETAARKEKDKINALKALGDEQGAKQHRRKLKAINEKYNEICTETGLSPQKDRMRVYGKGSNVEAHRKISVVDKNKNGGIINERGFTQRNLAMGLRKPRTHILSENEIQEIKKDIIAINADVKIFRFNSGFQTSYVDEYDIINIRGDVLPDKKSNNPRDLMSSRAVIAHEYYGHRAYRGTKLPKGSWNDEFRASYMAAKNTPNLTDKDRQYLILDALERAKEKGISIKHNQFIRSMLYGY